MKEWWSNLALKEKQAVLLGAVLLSLFLIYEGLWLPLINQVDLMRTRIASEQKTLTWMKNADSELQQLQGNVSRKVKPTTPVLALSMLQKQINQAGLTQNLTQLKQASNDVIQMHFQKIAFDQLASFLMTALKEQNITIEQMSVVADGALGVVDVDLMLKL